MTTKHHEPVRSQTQPPPAPPPAKHQMQPMPAPTNGDAVKQAAPLTREERIDKFLADYENGYKHNAPRSPQEMIELKHLLGREEKDKAKPNA